MMDVPPKQRLLLQVLLAYKREHGVAPSVRELQKLAKIGSPTTVLNYLVALEEAGYIERSSGARNISVIRIPEAVEGIDRASTILVPIVGHVAAGAPILAVEDWEDSIKVSTTIAKPPHKYFFLRVRGNSMNRAGIEPGHLALVRQQSWAQINEKVVALINDHATIKRYRPHNDVVVLEPDSTDPTNKPIVVDRDFQIQGVVIASFPESTLR